MTAVDSTHPTPSPPPGLGGDVSGPGEEALSPRWRGIGSVANRTVLEGPAKKLVRVAETALDVPADRSALRRSLGKPPSHPLAQPAHRLVGPCLPEAVLAADDRDGGGERSGRLVEIDAVEKAFYTVAALIAAQPRSARDEQRARAAAATTDTAGADPVEPGAPTDVEPTGGVVVPVDAVAGEIEASGPPASDPAAKLRVSVRSRSLGRCLADAVNRAPTQREQTEVYSRLEARLRLMCRQDVDGLHRHLPRLVAYLRSDQIDIDWVRLLTDLARWGVDGDTVAKTWLQQFYGSARPARSGAGGTPEADTDTDGTDGAVDEPESERP